MKDQHMEGHGENQDPSMEQLLTAYLLGECDEATAARVEEALAADDLLRARKEALEEVLGLLRKSAPEAPASLAPERREALRAEALAAAGASSEDHAPTATRQPWWQAPTWRMAAGLLIFGGAMALWQPWSGDSLNLRPGYEASGPAVSGRSSEAKLSDLGYAGPENESSSVENSPATPGRAHPGNADSFDMLGKDKNQDFLGQIQHNPAPGAGGVVGGMEIGNTWGSDAEANDLRARLKTADAETMGLLPVQENAPEFGFLVDTGDVVYSLQPEFEYEVEEILLDPAVGGVSTPSTPAPDSPPSGAAPMEGLAANPKREANRQPEALRRDVFGAPSTVQEDASGGRFAGDEANELGDDDLRALSSLGYSGGGGGGAFERKQRADNGYVVIDGYGRRYHNQQILNHLHRQEQERPSDMFFRYYGDNAAVLTTTNPLSTFAADVDSASYALSRAYLVEGNVPPKAAVRTEEFLNYFDYDLPVPTEDDFAVYMEGGPSVFSREPRQLLGIGVKAKEIAADARPAMNLVFVIDKSGSMEGERMQLVKDALELVIDQLKEDDTLGLVTFDSRGHVLQESIPVRERYKLRRAVRSLSTGGSTNAGEGLALGYEMIEKVFDPKRINRVILASDGVANTGETDQQRILADVKSRAEAEVDLTTLGVGMGNHNDVFLEQLADQGDGSCHYLDDFAEAKRVLVDDFLGTLVTVGRQLKIQVEFDPKVVQRWRQLGYENRSLTAAQFRDDSVDAGEVGSGQDVIALYELDLMPEADAEAILATVRLRWIPEDESKAVERSFPMTVGELTGRWGLASKRLRLAAVTAQLAETLRQSWHARGDDRELLASEAERLAQEWSEQSEVAELRDMIRRAHSLLPRYVAGDELTQLMEEARWMNLRQAEIEQLQEGQDQQEELLEALRLQNAALEARLQELLQGR